VAINLHINQTCYHCGQSIEAKPIVEADKSFCCNGCATVYNILVQKNLCQYYTYQTHPGIKVNNSNADINFDYYNSETVANAIVKFKTDTETNILFEIPNMHCISCIWLLEQLPTLVNGVINSRVNFDNKELYIQFNHQQTNIGNIVKELIAINYEPVINLQQNEKKQELALSRLSLLKLGVAGFCFANIMMLSFPEYLIGSSVVEPKLANYFKSISVLLSLPVLFFSASGFFKTAISGLKRKVINIDLPVVIALIVTFSRSIYEITVLGNGGYLDSFSGIVFFMLIGRWVQSNTHRAINFNRDFKSFFPIATKVINQNQVNFKPISNLLVNDLIEIRHQEIIPCDSVLLSESALIDYSFVTGESNPITVTKGQYVYAGGKQLSGIIQLNVQKTVEQSYLTSLWSKSKVNAKSEDDKAINNIGLYFTIGVLFLAVAAAMYWLWNGNTTRMWNAITTVLIVACPCALLLSEHFTNGNVLGILGNNGFYLKSKNVLHQILKINYIVFDKTGTLTNAKGARISYFGKAFNSDQQVAIISVLQQSVHPLATAIAQQFSNASLLKVTNFKVTNGAGVEAWLNDTYYKIGSASFLNVKNQSNISQVHIAIDNQYYGYYEVAQQYRNGLKHILNKLSPSFKFAILSGDTNTDEKELQNYFPKNTEMYFEKKPNEKLEIIAQLQKENNDILFIGDGLNDAGALQEARVGVAVSDNNSLFTPRADAIIKGDQIALLATFLTFIQYGRKVIWLTFIISAIYNVIGLYYALQGILSPLIAAILMPLSSLTIIGITYFLVTTKAKYLKLKLD
jgi:P-type Cu+ transporter